MAGVRETWVRSFTVTDPTTHEKGFTVYKVTYKAFALSRPEETIEVIVWKRYNDFKKLHKVLAALHYNLRRPEKFPEFAKAKIFGRFDDSVIEERRNSALNLLEFASRVPVLAKSQLMQNFFKGGEEVLRKKPTEPPILRPSNIAILTKPKANAQETDPASSEMISASEGSRLASGDVQEEITGLGGVWLHRQDEDSQDEDGGEDYVYEGSDDERTTFSEDSLPNTPLPQLQDIAVFDPLAGDDLLDAPLSPSLHTSNSWLFHAMDLCADLKGGDSPDQSEESSLASSSTDLSSTDGGITLKLPQVPDSSPLVEPAGEPAVLPISQDIGFSSTSIPQGPSRDQRSSMAQAYLRCIKAQEAADRDALLDVHSGIVDSREETPNPSPQHGESRERTVSGDSISKLVIRGEEDYLYKAAQAIGLALQNEANGFYQAAFDSYKAGVSILLNGVVGEANKTRREAVRKKTAQYLMRAEDVYNNYLSDMDNSKRWESETLAVESDPSSEHLRGSTEELKKYKVLGVVDRVMLVLDMTSYQTFVIKVLNKCAVANDRVRTCIPSYCPYMVRLSRFIESDSSIFLVLEHASGGKLWEYVSSYLNQEETESQRLSPSGHRALGTRSQSPQSPRAKSLVGDKAGGFGDTESNDRTTEQTHRDIDSVKVGRVCSGESDPELREFDGGKERTGQDQTAYNLLGFGSSKGPAGRRCKSGSEGRINNDMESPTGNRSTGDSSSCMNNPSSNPHQPTSIDVGKSPEAGPHADLKMTWISSSPSASEGSSQGSSTPVVPVELLPPSVAPLGNGSGEFEIVDDGESLNDLVEQSASSYHGNVASQNRSGEGTQGDEGGTLSRQRFSLFSLDSTEDNPSTVASPDDSPIAGSPEKVFNGVDNHNKGFIPVIEGQDANGKVLDTPKVGGKVHEIVEGDDKNSLEDVESCDSSQFDIIPTADIGVTSVPYDRSRFSKDVDCVGDEVFTGRTASQEGGVDNDVNNENDMEHENDLENPGSDDTKLSPRRKRSNKWEEFFKLNESDDNRVDTNKEIGHSGSTGMRHTKEVSKSGEQRNGFNICVNPFEMDPKGSSVSHGSAQTCVLVDDPSQPRRTSVEVIKEWPSSPSDSTASTPKKQLTDGQGNVNRQSDAADDEVVDGKSANVTGADGKVAGDRLSDDDKMQSNRNNIRSSDSNEQTANATSRDNDPMPTRNARLPSLSKLFSHLDDIRRSQGAMHLPESCIRIWAAEIAVALSSLHAYGIICRDLNPANILLAQGGHIRLTYFSHWKCIKPIHSTFAVENSYVAPEIQSLQPVTPACDWWSYGVLLFELLTGRSLHSCHPCGISTHTELSIPNHVSDEGRRLLKQLIQPVPHERLGAGRSGVAEIKAHPFFADINWNTLRG